MNIAERLEDFIIELILAQQKTKKKTFTKEIYFANIKMTKLNSLMLRQKYK